MRSPVRGQSMVVHHLGCGETADQLACFACVPAQQSNCGVVRGQNLSVKTVGGTTKRCLGRLSLRALRRWSSNLHAHTSTHFTSLREYSLSLTHLSTAEVTFAGPALPPDVASIAAQRRATRHRGKNWPQCTRQTASCSETKKYRILG